jgi:hypothetical protein
MIGAVLNELAICAQHFADFCVDSCSRISGIAALSFAVKALNGANNQSGSGPGRLDPRVLLTPGMQASRGRDLEAPLVSGCLSVLGSSFSLLHGGDFGEIADLSNA